MEHIVFDESDALAHPEVQRQFQVFLLAGDQTQFIDDALEGICPRLQRPAATMTGSASPGMRISAD